MTWAWDNREQVIDLSQRDPAELPAELVDPGESPLDVRPDRLDEIQIPRAIVIGAGQDHEDPAPVGDLEDEAAQGRGDDRGEADHQHEQAPPQQ